MGKIVRDLMHRGLITCRQGTSLGEAALLLHNHHIHSLIVADRDGRPVGILSDFDLLAGEWLSADSETLATMRKITAGDLMSYPITSVEASVSVQEAARLMLDKEIGRLLVTEDSVPVGVIASSDFVASIAGNEAIQRQTVADVMSDAILVCREQTPITSAARTMTQARMRSVLVVNAQGKPLGVVSEHDLMKLIQNGSVQGMPVSDVMHAILTIDMHASLREAADMMIQNHHHRLIVVDGNQPEAFPLGIVSSFDIVAEMARPGSAWQA